MKKFFEDWAVTICGGITSALTALIILLVHHLIGFNLFTLSFWAIVPVGAFLCGFAAASGYYLGSLYFNHKPTKSILVNMVVIAAATQIVIYYLEYYTLVLNDGTIARDYIGFLDYMNISLTKAKYSIGRNLHNSFEVGSFGYFLAFAQFIGFSIGGLAVYGHLKGMQMCNDCNKYFKKFSSIQKSFIEYSFFKDYAERLYSTTPGSEDYKILINENLSAGKIQQGNVNLTLNLHSCPDCKGQYVGEKITVYNGKDWKEVSELERNYMIPKEIDLKPDFAKKKAA